MKASILMHRLFLAASVMLGAQEAFATDATSLATPQQETSPVALAPSARNLDKIPLSPNASSQLAEAARPCHWWQFRRCNDNSSQLEGLPPDAPRIGYVVTIDVSRNVLYLYRDGQLVSKSSAATGTGKVLKKGRKVWAFHTPRGHLKVLRRIKDPIWTKPDWAFVEEGKTVPPSDSPKRLVKGHLGKYALDLGDGIMIHGTDDADSIGRYASHGCVRLPGDMLQTLWNTTSVGTDIFIFESVPPPLTTASNRPEHHSDLD